jgi:TrmH family RNA methyltransferase
MMAGMDSPVRPILTSTANPRIKAVLALRDRRDRERTGLTLVDGTREIRRAIEARASVTEAFVCEPQLAGVDARAILDRLSSDRVPVTPVGAAVLERIAFGERAEGIVAVVRIPDLSLDRIELPANPLVVVLEAVEKPGNLGAVLRSADGAGAHAVVLADPRVDPFNPNAIRASAGTVFGVPVAVGSGVAVLGWLRERGLRIVTTRVNASDVYTRASLTGPLALVFGAEATGLSETWTGEDIEVVRLPMQGIADSLNVSVSAAIVLYEAVRQRGLVGQSTGAQPAM